MKETLIVKNLGPIGKLEIKPRPLTILIGEQASGKSLVALLLYFFRGLESHLGRIYNPDLIQNKSWPQLALRKILDGLRAVPFNYFANGTASIRYKDETDDKDWEVRIYEKRTSPYLSKPLIERMHQWNEVWSANPEALGESRMPQQVFIPTDRSMFTRLARTEPSVLYGPHQPEPVKNFARQLRAAELMMPRYPTGAEGKRLARPLQLAEEAEIHPEISEAVHVIVTRLGSALGGLPWFEEKPSGQWRWIIEHSRRFKALPIDAVSSGQMEAWPFYAVAVSAGAIGAAIEHYWDFYFEEPETHLHPSAQVEVMRVIAYLVKKGHRFVVTTHSPFIGYVVDNMIQGYISHKGKVPKGQVALNPDYVAAYRLRQRPEDPPEDIMDRKDTKLLKLDGLEQVADELGKEFDELMDMAE